ncbi:MAG: hypothetical protein GY844_32815 [Bradyrhizobium sp.]|nr:hypothetical protein [Bradyrhizobium sp.]
MANSTTCPEASGHASSIIGLKSFSVTAALLFAIAMQLNSTARAEDKDPLGTTNPVLLPIPSKGPFLLPSDAPSTDPTRRDFIMNGRQYRIPRNMIQSLETEKDGTAAVISMRLLLPDLTGLTKETIKCADNRNPCSQDSVVVGLVHNEYGASGSQQLRNMQSMLLPEKFVGSCGLEFYESNGYEEQRHQYFILEADNDPSILRCSKYPSFGSCSSRTNIGDGNHFYYVFYRRHLCEWPDIRAKIINLIASFSTEPPK